MDFPQVAFWRADFAPVSLGELMNQLAITENGVLLPREFMETYFFNVGDTINVTVEGYAVSVALALKIVGSFDYFPTWYPDTGANLTLNYTNGVQTNADFGKINEDNKFGRRIVQLALRFTF